MPKMPCKRGVCRHQNCIGFMVPKSRFEHTSNPGSGRLQVTEANGPETKMRLDIRDQPLFFAQGLIQTP